MGDGAGRVGGWGLGVRWMAVVRVIAVRSVGGRRNEGVAGRRRDAGGDRLGDARLGVARKGGGSGAEVGGLGGGGFA